MTGLLSKIGEDLTITRKLDDGTTMTVKSPNGARLDMNGLIGNMVEGPVTEKSSAMGYQGGGMIGGPFVGPTADNVGIMANPGEYVVNVPATQKYKGLLEQINQDGRHMLKQGGYVNTPKPMGYNQGGGIGGPFSGYGNYSQQDFLQDAQPRDITGGGGSYGAVHQQVPNNTQQYQPGIILDPKTSDKSEFDRMNQLVNEGIYTMDEDQLGRAFYNLTDLGKSYNVRNQGSGVDNPGVDTSARQPVDNYHPYSGVSADPVMDNQYANNPSYELSDEDAYSILQDPNASLRDRQAAQAYLGKTEEAPVEEVPVEDASVEDESPITDDPVANEGFSEVVTNILTNSENDTPGLDFNNDVDEQIKGTEATDIDYELKGTDTKTASNTADVVGKSSSLQDLVNNLNADIDKQESKRDAMRLMVSGLALISGSGFEGAARAANTVGGFSKDRIDALYEQRKTIQNRITDHILDKELGTQAGTGKVHGRPVNVEYRDPAGNKQIKVAKIIDGNYYLMDDEGEWKPAFDIAGTSDIRVTTKSEDPGVEDGPGGIPNAVYFNAEVGIPTFDFKRESEGKTYGYAVRAIVADRNLREIEKDIPVQQLASLYVGLNNWARENAGNKVSAAVLNELTANAGIQRYNKEMTKFLQGVLRTDTGAAYTGTEISNYIAGFGIAPGDAVDENTRSDIQRGRAVELTTLSAKSGKASPYLTGLLSGQYPLPDYDKVNEYYDDDGEDEESQPEFEWE